MNINKILYATDFSPDSEAALEFASSLSALEGATLIIAHVDDDTPGLVLGDVGYGYSPQIDEIAQEELDRLRSIVPTRDGVTYHHRFSRGSAANGILRLAEEEHADLIVIGTHGRTGIKLLLMGSVAEAVVRHAKCPVLTVKQPEKQVKNVSLLKKTESQT